MSEFLTTGDIITLEETAVAVPPEQRGVTTVYIIKIMSSLKSDLADVFRAQARPSEGLSQFIVRTGIGRIISPRQAYGYKFSTNTVIEKEV